MGTRPDPLTGRKWRNPPLKSNNIQAYTPVL